ncbi:TPA: hypothetical protein L3N15_004177 [Vibrio parahaemolyticus]|nr:hypothetical protein [Vibrio parahaemolyticus]
MSKPLTEFEAKVLKQLKQHIERDDEKFNTLSRIEHLDHAAAVAGSGAWPLTCALSAKPGEVHRALVRLCSHGLVVRTKPQKQGVIIRWFPVSLYPAKGTFTTTKKKVEVEVNA